MLVRLCCFLVGSNLVLVSVDWILMLSDFLLSDATQHHHGSCGVNCFSGTEMTISIFGIGIFLILMFCVIGVYTVLNVYGAKFNYTSRRLKNVGNVMMLHEGSGCRTVMFIMSFIFFAAVEIFLFCNNS